MLFDKDGTLIDFNATWLPVLKLAALAAAEGEEDLAGRLLVAGGYDLAAGAVRGDTLLAAGNTVEIAAAWGRLLPGGPTRDLVPLLDKIFAEEGTRLAQPVTDLVALFGRLKRRGLALGVATSDSHASACSNLARLRLSDLVDFVAGYDSGYGGKPGPGMVRGFCAATRLAAAEVMVVGDNRHDLEMGRSARAGLVVGVLSGTGSRKALAPYADRLIKSVDELEPLLDGRMPADEPAG